ncbi:MAG: AzlD domain-containing protein [Leclercia sp.]
MERHILLTIVAAALVTALMRTVPVLLLSRFRLPEVVQQWLSFIPVAIMAAIVTAELLSKPAMTSSGISIALLAAGCATVVGIITRGLFATVLAGVVAYTAAGYFLA